MALEIERKFLVVGDTWRTGVGVSIVQGYLGGSPTHSVRVRTAGDQAWLSIKAQARHRTRHEFEYEIPLADAHSLLDLCSKERVEKIRRTIFHSGNIWEVDEFLGRNRGLIVAEIELEFPDQPFDPPDWLGTEVTDDPRYLNSRLAQHPFQEWA